MQSKINHDNDCTDRSEEYFKEKNDAEEQVSEEYFPLEYSTPPHY